MYIISILILVPILLVSVVCSREIKIQNNFEKDTREQWYSMTEEERRQSGRENMYC